MTPREAFREGQRRRRAEGARLVMDLGMTYREVQALTGMTSKTLTLALREAGHFGRRERKREVEAWVEQRLSELRGEA
jgi:hypothetical protein